MFWSNGIYAGDAEFEPMRESYTDEWNSVGGEGAMPLCGYPSLAPDRLASNRESLRFSRAHERGSSSEHCTAAVLLSARAVDTRIERRAAVAPRRSSA